MHKERERKKKEMTTEAPAVPTLAAKPTSMMESTQMDYKQWENSQRVFTKDKKILQEKAEQEAAARAKAEQEREQLQNELRARDERMAAEERRRQEIEAQLRVYQQREKESIGKKISSNIAPMLENMKSVFKDTESIKPIEDLDSYLQKELENGFTCNDSKTVVEFVNVGASMMQKQASALESSFQRGKELERQVEDFSSKFKSLQEERDKALSDATESQNAIKELQKKIEEMQQTHAKNIKDVDYHMVDNMESVQDSSSSHAENGQPSSSSSTAAYAPPIRSRTSFSQGHQPQMVMATSSRTDQPECFAQLLAQRDYSNFRESVRGGSMPMSIPNSSRY